MQGAAEFVRVPSKLGADFFVIGAPAVLQNSDIKKGSIAIAGTYEPLGRRTGEDNALLLRQMEYVFADG